MSQIRRVMTALLATGLLSACGMSPTLTMPKALNSAKSPAATQLPSAPVAPAPTAKQVSEPAAAVRASSIRLLSTADMTEDEMAEDDGYTYGTQATVATVTHFERTGYIRQLRDGTLELETTTGIFKRTTEDFSLTGNPSTLYALASRVNQKAVIEGTLAGSVVTVDSYRYAIDWASLFNFFTKGRISGTVKDANEWPVPGVTVTATRTTDHFIFRTATDTDGAFVLRSLVPGTYEVEIAPPGAATSSTTVTVNARKSAILAGHL